MRKKSHAGRVQWVSFFRLSSFRTLPFPLVPFPFLPLQPRPGQVHQATLEIKLMKITVVTSILFSRIGVFLRQFGGLVYTYMVTRKDPSLYSFML